MMQAPKPWTHWTNKGTFKIVPVMLGGSPHCELWLNDTRLGTYSYVFTASASISNGEHDQALGIEAVVGICSRSVPLIKFSYLAGNVLPLCGVRAYV